jgi:hypothetical protein
MGEGVHSYCPVIDLAKVNTEVKPFILSLDKYYIGGPWTTGFPDNIGCQHIL